MASSTEQIKDRINAVDLIGSYLKLTKAGINYKANCPFHTEKTPSFFVSPSRNSFYCFGCGAKGDIFEFIQKFEGLDFQGALRLLADKAGVSLADATYENNNKSEKEELYKIMEEATDFFEKELEKRIDAKKYLTERGLSEKTIKSFRVGFSKPEWRSLSSHLIEKGFKESDIEKAGLSKPGNRGRYDRFRGRIMFPIADSGGRVIAFSGRVFDKSLEGEESDPAKYVNSPETLLYHKSRTLYGFDKAKEGIRRFTYTIVVEGQMDLLMSHQAGFNNTVAISGTAMTEEQLSLIKRFTDKLLLSLDADTAGVSASGKSTAMALKMGFDVKIANLKGGKDPADIIKDSSDAWKNIIKNAKHIIIFLLESLSEKISDNRKFRLEVSKQVLPFITLLENAIDRAHFTEIISNKLSVSKSAIEEELVKISTNPENRKVQTSDYSRPEKQNILSSRKDKILQNIIGYLNHPNLKEKEKNKVFLEIEKLIGKEIIEEKMKDEQFVSEAVFIVEEIKSDRPIEREINELLIHLAIEMKKVEAEVLKKEMAQVEGSGVDMGDLINKHKKVNQVIGELQELLQKNNF